MGSRVCIHGLAHVPVSAVRVWLRLQAGISSSSSWGRGRAGMPWHWAWLGSESASWGWSLGDE